MFGDSFKPLGACLAVLLIMACGENQPATGLPEREDRYNVIVLVVDALRADRLGAYGYSRPTSPFIDRLAAEGIVFDQAQANSSFTRESVASLLTGFLPSRSGSVGWSTAPLPDLETLGEFFSRAGYRTGFFSNTPVLHHPDFAQGFEVAEVSTGSWNQSGGGLRLSSRVVEFAEEHRDERFLVYAHYLDPHGPYAPPDEYYLRFAESRFPQPVSLYAYVRQHFQELIEDGFGPGDPRFEDLMLRYDAEIAFIDHAIQELYEGLERAGLAESTLIVLTSDHGEEFLEHGFVEHAWTLHREVLHVPLIFWAHGASASRVGVGVSLVDLLPSLLELNRIPYQANALDGRTLFRLEDDLFVPDPQPRAHLAELLIADRNQLRTVIRGEWKYIAAWGWLPPEERFGAEAKGQPTTSGYWGPPIREELYNVVDDPEEKVDLAEAHPEVISMFRETLESYRHFCATAPGADSVRELSDEDRAMLQSLGYL